MDWDFGMNMLSNPGAALGAAAGGMGLPSFELPSMGDLGMPNLSDMGIGKAFGPGMLDGIMGGNGAGGGQSGGGGAGGSYDDELKFGLVDPYDLEVGGQIQPEFDNTDLLTY